MTSASKFRAQKAVGKAFGDKANEIQPIYASVGNGDGVTVATGRANFYWIRLYDDDDRLAQCFSLLPLAYDDVIYVKEVRDRKVRYYELLAWISNSVGGTTIPLRDHDHSAVTGEGGQLDWDDIWTDAVHDHSSAAEGGDDLYPERISYRTFLVGPSCPYLRLEQAIAAVVAYGPTTTTRCIILVMATRTAETGACAVPQYCEVVGLGDNSIVNMQGNALTLASDTGMRNLKVLASVNCVDMNNASNVVLRDVTVEVSSNVYCFYARGTTTVNMYGCIAQTTAANARGFVVADGADAYLYECVADDTTNFAYGLYLNNVAGTTVETHNCEFHAATDDAYIDTSALWTYHTDAFDPDNCTINGTAEPADSQPVIYWPVTKTVTTDFATIQAAIDWFKNRLLCAACKIDVDAGAYDEAIVFEDIFCAGDGRLELEGDTRVLAGASFVDGAALNQVGLANGGSGTGALSNAGTDITVTGTVTNPDFDADGWGSGDHILVWPNAGGPATVYTISSTLNNVITLTVAAPAIGNDGTAICLIPNRSITRTTAGPCIQVDSCTGILIDGWCLESATGADCHGVFSINGAAADCENILARAEDYGFYAQLNYSTISAADGACSAWECARGFVNTTGANIDCSYMWSVGCTYAAYAAGFSVILASYCVMVNNTWGALATDFSFINAGAGTARQTTNTAYLSSQNSYLSAAVTAANNNANGTDYTPAPGMPPAYAESATDFGVLRAS